MPRRHVSSISPNTLLKIISLIILHVVVVLLVPLPVGAPYLDIAPDLDLPAAFFRRRDLDETGVAVQELVYEALLLLLLLLGLGVGRVSR